MRERYLEAFDTIRIDSLNGDKYKTGKITPDGKPDPSIFSTPGRPGGHSSRHRHHHAGQEDPNTPPPDRWASATYGARVSCRS